MTGELDFAAVMGQLGVAFNQRVSADRINLYESALRDIPPDRLRAAAAAAINECKFFPTPAELRRLAEGTTDDNALVAWAALEQAASSVGAWRAVEVDDACAAEALVAVFGSWPEFCQMERGPELAMRRQEFMAAYRRARREQAQGPRKLSGLVGGPPAQLQICAAPHRQQIGDGGDR